MRLFGLIGYPLGHSFSKKYFEEKFISEHIINAKFLNFELENLNDLHALIHDMPQLEGFSVTIPYKSSILPFVDILSDEVKEIGALNAVKIWRRNGKIELSAHNTDTLGFEKSFTEHNLLHHKQALILGTGGSSKAVAYTLRKLKIDYLFVSRNNETDNTLLYSDLMKDILSSHSLIINTTPSGMFPDIDTCPDIPYNLLTNKHFLFDLIYNPAQTLFMQKGCRQGVKVCNGYNMLRHQADEAWRIWNG